MSTYAPGEKDAQLKMIALLEQAEALAPQAGLRRFFWHVETVTGYDTKSEWVPEPAPQEGLLNDRHE